MYILIKPANRTTLYEDVVSQISEQIKDGNWLPGERIPGELELADSFRVSRNCIREALKSLELTGILESQPGRGTFVSNDALRNIRNGEFVSLLTDEATLYELMEVRMIIEVQMAYLAAERATGKEIRMLEKVLEEDKKYMDPSSNWERTGLEFHNAVARITNNRVIVRFLESINDLLHAQRHKLAKKITKLSEQESMIAGHQEIFDAIKDRQPDNARNAMYKHLKLSLDILTTK